MLKELGSDGMLRHATIVKDNLGLDAEILATYVGQYLGGIIGEPYDKKEGRISTQM